MPGKTGRSNNLGGRILAAILTALLLCAAVVPVAAAQEAVPGTESPTATVIVAALNVRAGPGLEFSKTGLVNAGDVLNVDGASPDCRWLSISTSSGQAGWISSNPRYVALDTDCASLATRAAEVATPQGSATTLPPAAPVATTAPTPTATVTPEPVSDTGVPAGKGCIDIGNYIGPELQFSGSRMKPEPKEYVDVTIPDKTVVRICLSPGTWGVTAAPVSGRWQNLSFDFTIQEGDLLDWPFWREF